MELDSGRGDAPGLSGGMFLPVLIREELSGLTDLSRVSARSRYLVYLDRVHDVRADQNNPNNPPA